VLATAARAAVAETARPTLVIIRSHIGFPSPEMMDRREAHGTPFSASAISEVKEILGVSQESFHFDPELPSQLVESLDTQRRERVAWTARLTAAGPRGDVLVEQLATNGAAELIAEPEPFAAGTGVATRKALQRAMDVYAPQCRGVIAGSADLTDNTGVVLPHSMPQNAQNPGGRQIHYGIREFAMGASLVGQALHGGFRPVGSTFFVFSDYMRGALRLASLSHAGALFVFTHDSVGVGEDGPTHQPVEQLMSLRAMPRLHVVRPSDANETLDLVGRFLSAKSPPTTALVLSRQDIPVMGGDEAAASREGARLGGYVVRERDDAVFTLVGTGSEVAHCLAASDELAGEGISTRVVALPCWRCFDEQPLEYRRAVLRREIPSVSLEAGATLGWSNYVDEAYGIDTFGLSAPGAYAFNYFNITAATLVTHVKETLGVSR